MPNRTKWNPQARAKFLEDLRKHANVGAAAAACNMGRSRLYELRRENDAFAADWAEAVDEAIDVLEREAWRRAVEGTDRPVYQGGKKVGEVREYSDRLTEVLLRAHRPDKYRERIEQQHQIVAPNGPMAVKHVIEAPEQIGEILDILAAAGALPAHAGASGPPPHRTAHNKGLTDG